MITLKIRGLSRNNSFVFLQRQRRQQQPISFDLIFRFFFII
jgi:hypothetical protein